MIRALIKSIIPERVRDWIWTYLRAPLNLFRHALRDAVRFLRYNTLDRKTTSFPEFRTLQASAHMLEKGLSLPHPRPLFGQDLIRRMARHPYITNPPSEGLPEAAWTGVLSVLNKYHRHHVDIGKEDEATLLLAQHTARNELLPLLAQASPEGGVHHLTKDDAIRSATAGPVSKAIRARHSVRSFAPEPVPSKIIRNAVEVASYSPSSCNLQPTRVHVTHDKALMAQALTIQRGARGFAEQVAVLLVLTYEIALQIGPRSRMQGYTDTGLFAQSLMLALLEHGVGSCPLNWAQEIATDRKLRKLLDIPASQNIVMLVAAGFLPDEFRVAYSKRHPVETILREL